MSSDSELIKALEGMVITPDPETQYRMYYNEVGDIVMCMMQAPFPDNKNYIVASKDQYEIYWRYKVVDGKLELIQHNIDFKVSFIKSNKGFRVVKNHASLLLEQEELFKDIEYYDTRNN